MKFFNILAFAFSVSFANAQTPLIAHKSHSGTAADFFIDPSSNFGIPSPRLVQVIRLNDSTSIEVTDHYNGYYHYDTIYRNPVYADYNLDIDSMQKGGYYNNVEYVNFRNSPKSVKQKAPGFDREKLDEQVVPQQKSEPQPEAAPKKKKKNALLFIFLVGGSGLLAFRILSRMFTPQTAA